MAKRVLIAIAVVAFLATTVQAYSPYIKADSSPESQGQAKSNWWPYEYKALDLCIMPIYMEVGMYVQLKDCNKKEIHLKQVPCDNTAPDPARQMKSAHDGKFPCYTDCVSFDIRANFEVKLGTRLEKTSSAIKNWEAYYQGDDLVPGDGGYHSRTVCVDAWEGEIWTAKPGDKVQVGNLAVTVKPN